MLISRKNNIVVLGLLKRELDSLMRGDKASIKIDLGVIHKPGDKYLVLVYAPCQSDFALKAMMKHDFEAEVIQDAIPAEITEIKNIIPQSSNTTNHE